MQTCFDHERLDVYQLARAVNRELATLLAEVPRGHAESKDNLRRAGHSVTRNIAEGTGRWKVPDKIHFYNIARASATECAASLDELVDGRAFAELRVARLKQMLLRVVAMLIAMIRALERRGQ